MKRWLRQIIMMVVVLAMITQVLPGMAFATTSDVSEPETTYKSKVNPLYEGLISEESQKNQLFGAPTVAGSVTYNKSIADAGKQMQEGMKARQAVISVGYQTKTYSSAYAYELFDLIFDAALVHTGDPKEGDSIRWQWGYWNAEMSYYTSGGTYYLTYTYSITYYTTAAQEAQFDVAVQNLLAKLDLYGQTDYEIVRGIYDYICANVTYDYANLYNENHVLKFTPYAALINKTAVCQGYALLFYRLALEMGVDTRLIAGIGNGGPHGWNIVRLDDLYYNLDSTWDAGMKNYSYFLKCESDFRDHYRYEEYTTSSFHAAYPMGKTNYNPENAKKLEGLNCVKGVWGYYTDGKLDTSYTNLVYYNDIFYYVENGLINWDYVGLAQHKETEIWYYVQGGGVDRSFTGLTMYNGRWFYLEAGSITWSYTGLVEFEGNWYFVNYSQLNFDYTDLVLHDGVWYYVQNSMLQWGYYGLVNYNGVWYYLENSHISWTFNDLVLYNDVWYYVKGSTIAWDYTGVVPYGGGMYYVENGTINWGFYGTFEQDGIVYNIENGMVIA